jgi:hypothetical protein
MRDSRHTMLVTSLAAGSLLSTAAVADIERKEMHGGEYVRVTVNGESWEPDRFDTGLEIPATFVARPGIVLDGTDDEAAWREAREVSVPLSNGVTDWIHVKALYTDSDVILRIRWPDATENRDYHPWVWDERAGKYEVGTQADDAVIFSFEAGCEWFPSFLSGYEFDFDGWHWTAGRTDPAGLAIDVSGSMKATPARGFTPYAARNDQREWNLKFTDVNDSVIESNVHSDWEQLERKYEIWPVDNDTVYFGYWVDGSRTGEFAEQLPLPVLTSSKPVPIVPQYALRDWRGNADDVRAKGHWEDGFWTVELRRKRITEAGLSYDVQFERLTQFSLHVFDGTERLDLSAESPRLYLRFLPQEPLLVSK